MNENEISRASLTRRQSLALALGGTSALLGGCGTHSRMHALSWEEEVILHDERRLWVKVTRHMQRDYQLGLGGIEKRDLPRDVEIEFDAGPPFGRFHRRFNGHNWVRLIEIRGDKLYLGLSGGGSRPEPKTISMISTWVVEAGGKEYALQDREEIEDLPVLNLLELVGEPKDYDPLENQRLSWESKWDWWRQHSTTADQEYDNLSKRRTSRQVSEELNRNAGGTQK